MGSQTLKQAMMGLVLAGTALGAGLVLAGAALGAGMVLAGNALGAGRFFMLAPPATVAAKVARAGWPARTPGLGAEGAANAAAQYGRYSRRAPRYPDPNAPIDGSFVFARVQYREVVREPLGQGWATDYPNGDRNFMSRLEEFTYAPVGKSPGGYPNHVVVTLYDEELFDYPFIFMSDVGTIGLDALEVERLREYLLRGGFLWVDDFWGFRAWDRWEREIGRVLSPVDYPIFDIEAEHPIRQMLYPVEEIPQIPSIQWWRRSGGYTTSERGYESETPHLRGISNKSGRLMVLMSHNTDIADGWERENEDWAFFQSFSFPAYAVGINVALYVMSH
jgi:hypothetical protein